MGIAVTAMVGILPIYGNCLRHHIAATYLLPWAVSHSVGSSWLLSTSGLLTGVLAAMCPGALAFPILENTRGEVPGVLLIIGVVILLVGSIYSATLFF